MEKIELYTGLGIVIILILLSFYVGITQGLKLRKEQNEKIIESYEEYIGRYCIQPDDIWWFLKEPLPNQDFNLTPSSE